MFQVVRCLLELCYLASSLLEIPKLTDRKYATKLYGEQAVNGTPDADEDDSDIGGDIEAEINKELADIRKPAVKPLFTSVKLDTQCCK